MMKMVGLSEFVNAISWLITQSVMLIIAATLFTGVGFLAKVFVYSSKPTSNALLISQTSSFYS